MKLYEFKLIDEHNLPCEELDKRIEGVLDEEQHMQGWKPGFTFHIVKSTRINASGLVEYLVEVAGEYL